MAGAVGDATAVDRREQSENSDEEDEEDEEASDVDDCIDEDEDEAEDEPRKKDSVDGVLVDGKSDVVGSRRVAGDCGRLVQAGRPWSWGAGAANGRFKSNGLSVESQSIMLA